MTSPNKFSLCVLFLVLAVGCNTNTVLNSDAQHLDVGIDVGHIERGDAQGIDLGVFDFGLLDADIEWRPELPATEPIRTCGTPVAEISSVSYPANNSEFAEQLLGKATGFERVFHGLSVYGTGLNADVVLTDSEAVEQMRQVADNGVEAMTSSPEALVARFGKAAGLYAGVGLAADAYRYKVLRDEGASCESVEEARTRVINGIETLKIVSSIAGTEGVIVRAIANKMLPGDGQNETVPLFDGDGSPLPREKNNGTWREDQSGLYPHLIWEDSCSRDMFVGWSLAYAAIWEVIATDPTISEDSKARLRRDAKVLLDGLMRIGDEGFDLEIRDADGRRTYHGILHEHSVDRVYVSNFPNGFNGLLAVGIVSALSYASGASSQRAYLENDLIDQRGLLELAEGSLIGLDLGARSNYSGYNMAFTGAWLGARYLGRESDRAQIRRIVRTQLYSRPDVDRQPQEQSQALYHLVFLQNELGATAFGTDVVASPREIDSVIERIRLDLGEFPSPPVFGKSVVNCNAQEIASSDCVAPDGTSLPLLGTVGWNDELVAAVPVPMRLRPISNYYWRSNPYAVNGESSELSMMPGSDFRLVYWAARLLYTAEGGP